MERRSSPRIIIGFLMIQPLVVLAALAYIASSPLERIRMPTAASRLQLSSATPRTMESASTALLGTERLATSLRRLEPSVAASSAPAPCDLEGPRARAFSITEAVRHLSSVELEGDLRMAGAIGASPASDATLTRLGLGEHPLSMVLGVAALSLLPFVAMTLTSFVKIAVVLSIARSAIGTQQLPPTAVLTGLAVILSVHVMAPVVSSAWEAATSSDEEQEVTLESIKAGAEPLTEFLISHAHPDDLALFLDVAAQSRGEGHGLTERHLLVAAPAFVIGELRSAFKIGFLIFLPFLVVDLVVSCVLLSLGMHMLSPTTVSLPFKLLLFVATDGWLLISEALVRGYLPAA